MNRTYSTAFACALMVGALAAPAFAQNETIVVGGGVIRAQPPAGANVISPNGCRYEASKGTIDACTAIIENPPAYPFALADAYSKRGYAYLETGKFREAVADLNQALHDRPGIAVDYNNRCFARARMDGVLNTAFSDCEKSLRLDPGKTYTLDSLAFVYFKQGDYLGAIAAYDDVLRRDPKFASALYMRGVTKVRRGDFINGHADINAAKRIDPAIARHYSDIRLD